MERVSGTKSCTYENKKTHQHNRKLGYGEERYKKREREKLTDFGMTLRAKLISHFERMASVPGPKVEKKQEPKRPAV
jgi:hypothetical protein